MATKKKTSEVTWSDIKDVRQELELMVSHKLGSDELRVLLRVARRLHIGYERYGAMRLSTDTRDYQKEASEEILDWLVYTEMDSERNAQKPSAARKKKIR